MVNFNYLSRIVGSAIFGLTTILSGCNKKEEATVAGPVRVNIEVAGATSINSAGRNYSGTVEALNSSTVSFSVPGTITRIYVEEGQMVSKGQIIAQVKSDNLINSRNIAQAELEEARDAYQRLKKLHDANALPDIKWVEIQAKLKQAENAADLADRAVGDATIHSPITGYITQKFANDGQTIIPAEPIVKIVSLSDLQISISVPENEISSFSPLTSATAVFDLPESLKVTGKMSHKDVMADPLTRSYTVKFNIENSGGKILPGMIGSVTVNEVRSDSSENANAVITLPSQAVLLSSDNHQFVWIVKDGKALRKDVVADELSTEGVTVRSGLTPGDSVIVAGMQKVSTGTVVDIIR